MTLHQVRVSAQKVFAARLEGRDLASEKRDARKRTAADRVEELLEAFITQHVSQNRSARAASQMLRRELGAWNGRSIHEISKRDVVEVVSAVEQRGAAVTNPIDYDAVFNHEMARNSDTATMPHRSRFPRSSFAPGRRHSAQSSNI